MNNYFELEGKKVLITGSSRGIGFATANLFHEMGATVLFSGTNQEKLDQIVAKFNERAIALACDLSKFDAIEDFCKQALAMLGGIDILICNAGIVRRGSAMEITERQWDEVFDVNLKSCFFMNQKISKYMMMKKITGSIINISSILGFLNIPGSANYSAAKAGLVAMTKTFAKEFALKNIRFNCVAPGYIETDMTSTIGPEFKQTLIDNTPMARWGNVHEITNAILFLASNKMSSYMTGQTLHVNGGMAMF